MKSELRISILETWSFLQARQIDSGTVASVATLFCLLFVLIVAMIAPALGTLLMEIGFPLLGAWLLYRKTADVFEPSVSFPSFYLIWCWIGSIPLINSEFFIRFGDGHWLYCFLGFIAFWSGTLVLQNKHSDVSGWRFRQIAWKEQQLFLVLFILAAVVLSAWGSITISEGIPIFKADVETLRVELPSRHRFAYQLLVLISNVIIPMAFAYLWTSKSPKFQKSLYLLCAFLLFALLSQGNRGLILNSVLTVFVMRHYLVKPWRVKYLVLAAVVLLPLLSVSGYYRSLQHFGPSYAIDLAESGIPLEVQPVSAIYLYVRSPLDTFRNVVKLIPATKDYQHGALTFGFFMQLLPGRHPSQDFFFKDLLGDTFEGFGEPASILGTYYADFGVAGIIVGMFLTGLLSRAVYIAMFSGSIGWLVVYCYLWQKLVGSIYGSLFTYIVELIVPITWLILLRVLTQRDTGRLRGLLSE